MSDSIFNIPNWAATTSYVKHDIVKYQSRHYYAKDNHTSGASFNSALWNGTTTFNGAVRPNFIWIPNYNSEALNQPRNQNIQFDDGYEQRYPDGISNDLLTLNYTFADRKIGEATAILHFFKERAGHESFVFTPPKPNNIAKRFVCRAWSHTHIFYTTFTVRATFNEVVN